MDMEAIHVDVRRKDDVLDFNADLQRAKILARLLDSEFSLAGVRFGLDAIVGLVPVVGDTVSFIAGIYPIHLARKHKLGRAVELRMWGISSSTISADSCRSRGMHLTWRLKRI